MKLSKERYTNVNRVAEVIKKLIDRLSAKTKLSKKLMLAVALLISGVVFLLLSEIGTEEKKEGAEYASVSLTQSVQNYAEILENRLVSIISSIDGAGATKVMVTLESGSEDVYLHNFDYGENVDPEGKNSMERKDDYVIVEGQSGEQGIIVRVSEPRVRGVAVVCEGGGSDIVREQIISAVTALLDISSARVSVAKMN